MNKSYLDDVTHRGPQVTQVKKISDLEQFKRNTEEIRPSNLWDPMLPPATENSNDDEFNDSSLSTAWTEFDPNNRLTIAENAYGALFTKVPVAGANHEIAGLYKTIPAGDFSIMIRLNHLTYQSGVGAYGYAGIGLWEDATNVARKVFNYWWRRDGTNDNVSADEWTNYTTYSGSKLAATVPIWRADSMYLRLLRSGTNYYVDYSLFGNGWMTPNAYSAITLSFTPLHMGIIINDYNSAINHLSVFNMFRYLNSNTTAIGVLEGNRL